MPLSYHDFSPAAILIMIVSVVIAELYKKYKQRRHQQH